MSWILALIMAAVAIGGGGLAHAADGAAPGDALYGLDRAMETLRLNLTTDPVESMELELAFAKERALEVGQTAGHGEPAHLGQALENYGDTISAVARGVAAVEGPAGDRRDALLTDALRVHDRVLERAFDGEDGDQAKEQVRDQIRVDWCPYDPNDPDSEQHPTAEMIAERYDTAGYDSDDVMVWFCEGAGFGEIMLAIRICGDTEGCVDDLFVLRQGDPPLGWGGIMRDHDVIGRPEHAGPNDDVLPGPPDHAGPPDGVPPGPADDAGPPDGVPPGPADDAGPPEGIPPGPADDAGPPEGVPPGPADDAGPPEGVPPGPGDDAGPPEDVPPGPADDAGPPVIVPPGPGDDSGMGDG
jgi:hypothetical protein